MATRGQELAGRYEEANAEFTAAIKEMSDTQWKATTPVEGWSVAAAAHHVAIATEPLRGFVQAASAGQPLPPITPEQLNALNAQHAKDFANATRNETLAALANQVPPTAQMLRSLSDEQLDKRAETPFGGPMTTQQIIENVLIAHVQGHLASIRGAK